MLPAKVKPLATGAAGATVGILASRASNRIVGHHQGAQMLKFFGGSALILAVASKRPTAFVGAAAAGFLGDTLATIVKQMARP